MDKTIQKVIYLFLVTLLLLLLCYPVSGYYYANPQVINISNTSFPITSWVTSSNISDAVYYSAYVAVLYYDCTDVSSGAITSTTYNNAGGAGGFLPSGDFYRTYPVPNCSATAKPYYSILNYTGVPNNFRIATSWQYVDVIPSVSFSTDVNNGTAPLTVTFTDTSSFTPTSNSWTYGDGTSYTSGSFSSPVQHTYTTAGVYSINYSATSGMLSGWGNKSAYINVYSANTTSTGGYTLVVSPATVNYNQNFTITLSSDTGNFTGIKEVRYGWNQSGKTDLIYDLNNYPLDYYLNAGTWYQYDGSSFSINKGASLPNPISLLPAKFGTGDFTIDAYLIKDDNQVIHVSDTLTVTSTNYQTLTIQAIDFNDGYIVSSAHINVLDIAPNIWENKSAGGEKIFNYPYGRNLYIDINSSAYYTSTKNYTVTNTPNNTIQIVMYRGITTPAGNVTLRVNVMDTQGGYLNNAKVTVLNDDSYFDSQSQYTNYAGIATFLVLPTTDYAISVSKSGYLSAGKLENSGADGTTKDTTIVLSVGANPTATPTPQPTATGQYIGNIGGSNLTPVTCQAQLPKGATILDSVRNNIACAGIQSGQNQGIAIAILIIFVLAIIGGKYGKGIGVVMGMGAGYVISLAMNLIPLWTFIALLVIAGIIFSAKIWGSDK